MRKRCIILLRRTVNRILLFVFLLRTLEILSFYAAIHLVDVVVLHVVRMLMGRLLFIESNVRIGEA